MKDYEREALLDTIKELSELVETQRSTIVDLTEKVDELKNEFEYLDKRLDEIYYKVD